LRSGTSSFVTSGGRFVVAYRRAIVRSAGDTSALAVENVTRYWRYRAAGAWMPAVWPSVSSADQSLQVSSGSATLPLGTATVTFVPSGESADQRSEPHLLTILASSTSEVRVPLSANLSWRT